MAENKNQFNETVQSLFQGMSTVLTTKTVVGEAVHIGDTIILPLVDVSFGMGAGSKKVSDKNSAQGGGGVKMSPSAVLVIHNGTTRLVNIKNQDTVTKLVDMIPELVDRIKNGNETDKENVMTDEDVINVVTKTEE